MITVLAYIQFAPVVWRILTAVSLLTGLGSALYSAFQEDPAIDVKAAVQNAQRQRVDAATRRAALREEIETEFSQARIRNLSKLQAVKTGLDAGYVSPVKMGIEGGGLAMRDTPLIEMVAAQIGMDPEDLAARFDPTRANIYEPIGQRGEFIRPDFKQATNPDSLPAGDIVPVAMEGEPAQFVEPVPPTDNVNGR